MKISIAVVALSCRREARPRRSWCLFTARKTIPPYGSTKVIARFSRGDSVPIAYSRIDPERARIDTLWFRHRWVIGGILVGLAIVIRARAPLSRAPNPPLQRLQ